MRIVDRKTFLGLPEGTIYCKGVRWAFDGLYVKRETVGNGNDWRYLNRAWPNAHDTADAIDILEQSLRDGSSFPGQDDSMRDGCFDDNDLFMIFERADLDTLAADVSAALRVSLR